MLKILIGDDHAVVRKGLNQIIAESPGMTVAGEASDGHEVLQKVKKDKYDVVVLDISMPGRSGLDILRDLKGKVPVLVLSMHPEEQYAVRALKAGANGYLTKESAPNELIKAIKTVSSGRRYITASLAEKLVLELDHDSQKPLHETLSDREYEVFKFIGSGKTVAEIADKLHLSAKTVSTYRVRILEKMKMKNNAQIVYYAVTNKLTDWIPCR